MDGWAFLSCLYGSVDSETGRDWKIEGGHAVYRHPPAEDFHLLNRLIRWSEGEPYRWEVGRLLKGNFSVRGKK